MSALLIILGVLLFLTLLLFLPITVDLSFSDKLHLLVKYFGITIFSTERETAKKKKNKKTARTEKTEDNKEKKSFFKKLCDEMGLLGAFKYCLKLLGIIVRKLVWVVKRLQFRNFCLDLTVCTDDAAKTAIEYGSICTAVYPMITFLETNAEFKTKKIDISTDFDKLSPEFKISFTVKARLIYLMIAALAVLKQYLKLKKDSEKNERK